MPEAVVAPPGELLRALAVLAEPPGPGAERLAALLGLSARPTASAYADVFLFQLYPYASVHVGAEGMLGGDARERVAGFWRAVGRVPPSEPDHLAALLGLYAALAEETSPRGGAEALLLAEGRAALLFEHLAPWTFAYLDRVVELVDGVYAEWARLLHGALRAEVERARSERPVAAREGVALDPATLPLHLRSAPPLPDPRTHGGRPFLDALLAPVRSGFTLVRADLARIALDLDLGLRAGERCYALEHLLSQAPTEVLSALSSEARRQAATHLGRRGWLGDTADFLAERAGSTATTLGELAVDHHQPAVATLRHPPAAPPDPAGG